MIGYKDLLIVLKAAFSFSLDFDLASYFKKIVPLVISLYHYSKIILKYSYTTVKYITFKSMEWYEKFNIIKHFSYQLIATAFIRYLKTILKKKRLKGTNHLF